MSKSSLRPAGHALRRALLLAQGARAGLLGRVAPAALVALACSDALAQQAGRIERLEEINVVANAVATPNDQTGNSVTVVTAEQIQQTQRRTATEVLQTVPGLNVVQSGGAGGTTAVFIRGTNANHVKVLIDGIEVNDPSSANGTFDFSRVLAADIERVEVLRGPQSGLYGSDAIGGVISVTTKKGDGPAKFTAMAEGGSFGTFNQAAGVRGSQEKVNYSFNVAHSRIGAQPVTPRELLPPWGRINNDSYENWTFSSKVGAQLTDIFGVNLVGRYTEARLRYTSDDFNTSWGPAWGRPGDLPSNQRDKQAYMRGELTASLLDGRFQNWFGVQHMRVDSYTKPGDWMPVPWSSGYQPPNQYIGERTKFDWRGNFEIAKGHNLIAGLEHQRDALDIPALDVSQTPMAASIVNRAGYVEYVGNVAERFFLTANVRRDENDQFGGHTTWRIAPSVHVPWTQTVLKASYGTGFKAPTLNQLYVSYPSFFYFANPNLKPERSRGFDIGFEQPLFDDRLRFGATYFDNRIKDLINLKYDSATFTSTLVNLSSARTYGFEAFARANVTDELSLRADYTYTVARGVSPLATAAAVQAELLRQIAEGTSQPELLRRPKHKASLQATWKPIDKLSLSATLVHVGSWMDVSRDGFFPRVKAPGYTLLNLAGAYDIAQGVTATARVDNIGNKQYQNQIGYRAPGLGAVAGLRVTY